MMKKEPIIPNYQGRATPRIRLESIGVDSTPDFDVDKSSRLPEICENWFLF